MKQQRIIDLLIYTAAGFTPAHGLLTTLLLFNRQSYNNIIFHHSESLTWYFIFFLMPLLAGIAFYFWLKNKSISKAYKIIFGSILILQIGFTITAAVMNSNYWGYAFKRPTVFDEIFIPKKLLSYSTVATDVTDRKSLSVTTDILSGKNFYPGDEFYYSIPGRIEMIQHDLTYIVGYSFGHTVQYNNPVLELSENRLENIYGQIKATNFIDPGEDGYNTADELSGFAAEFLAVDNSKYLLTGLKGRQVSNDHYPYYEFLFTEIDGQYKLIKKQKFYTDVAGIEGLEYANIAPAFSLLLTVIGLFASLLIEATKKIMKLKNKSQKKRLIS
ncbi:MAG: hypothetical protein EOO87_19475 [Pedobacter sp.]|nr:MAG: hypothetical protein EOO87_19475 [Pedobacter sp.]